jgi:hypothetical protein
MGMAPTPERMQQQREGGPPQIRKIVADGSPPSVIHLRDLVRAKLWEVFEDILNIAELGGLDQYHWTVCRRQMLKKMNEGDEQLRQYINQILGLPVNQAAVTTPDQKG